MKIDKVALIGLLLALGSAQFMVAMMLGEATAPEYSMHDSAISDLGTIDETRLLFNASLFAIGMFNALAGYLLYGVIKDRIVIVVFVLGGVGAMGAGVIPLDSKIGLHGLFALVAFLFMNVEAILIARHVGNPLRIVSLVAGVIGIIFTVMMLLVDSESIDVSGSIGHGGTERMIAYPLLVWMMIFGGYLLGSIAPFEAARTKTT